jgi:hypothetical protein
MKVLAAADRDALHSQSQLVLVSKGMRAWLHAAGEINVAAIRPSLVSSPRVQPQSMDSTMVALIADMALNTWKEAGSW